MFGQIDFGNLDSDSIKPPFQYSEKKHWHEKNIVSSFLKIPSWYYINDTVEGRNPALVDMVNNPLFTRFYISQVLLDF